MNKTDIIRRLSSGCVAAVMAVSVMGFGVNAEQPDTGDIGIVAEEDGYVYMKGLKAARIQPDGSFLMVKQATARDNGRVINFLINGDEEKVVQLPSGKLSLDRVLIPGSNTTIIATGTTVYQTNPLKNLIIHEPSDTGYNSLSNVTIKGGTWKVKDIDKQTRATSIFRFNFANNITIDGCKVLSNYKSHAIEIIACKDVKVKNCKLVTKGKKLANSLEEALQIDIATPATAPSAVPYGLEFVEGQTCKNITVKDCEINGARGICANKTDTYDGKYLDKYHKNITITGCRIIGDTSEAVALHNAVGLKVKNNTIISKGSRTDTVYTIGLNIATFKSNGISSKYKNVITGNVIKGGRQGLFMAAYAGNKFGPTTVKNNKVYCKKGKSNAIKISNCKKLVQKGNKKFKW